VIVHGNGMIMLKRFGIIGLPTTLIILARAKSTYKVATFI